MKGWQNYKYVCQKVNCDDKQLWQINEIENNPYIIGNQQMEDGFILHRIPYDECISLNDLLDAIKFNYVVIYKGQVILIIQAIVQHLIKMAKKNQSHQQLNLNNIFIKLQPQSNKFTTYQSIIQIDKIYLLQYLIVSNPKTDILNLSEDVNELKKIIIHFLEYYQDENFDKLKEQIKGVQPISKVKTFKQINEMLDKFIQDFINVNDQTMRKNELESYNKSNRQRKYCEEELLNQLNDILKLKILFDDTIVDQIEQEMKEQNENLKESEKIQQYLLSYIQPLFVKQFQRFYGDKLQNSYLLKGITKNQYNELLTIIEKDKQRANRSFEALQRVIDDCLKDQNQIKQEIFQDFKFIIEDLPKEVIFDSLYKSYIQHSLDHDFTQQEQYQQVNQKVHQDVKKYIEEQYEMVKTLENVQLISEFL